MTFPPSAALAGVANAAAKSGAASSADAEVRTDFFKEFLFRPVMFWDANPPLYPWARTTLRYGLTADPRS